MNRTMRAWWGPVVIAVTLTALTIWTWGKWPDALIDFGRELYVPWQLSQGRTLYGDILYFNGPLSPTLNALLFRLVGPSLRALVLLNLAVLVAIVAMVYDLVRSMTGRFAATVGSLVVLVFFAFAQFMPGGNYTYLAPYSHEATHGLALSLAALTCLERYSKRGQPWWMFAAGVAAGFAFLTKAEFPIALAPALCVGLFLHLRAAQTPLRQARSTLVLAAAGFLLPPLFAFAWLSVRLPVVEALRGVAGSWNYLFDGRLHALRFYRDVQGTLDVSESVRIIVAWLGRFALVFLPAAMAAWFVRREAPESRALAGLLAAGAITAVLLGRSHRDWENLARPFPLFLAATALVVLIGLRARNSDRETIRKQVLGVSLLVFGFLLLLKTILYTSLLHYGFVLTMPAGIIVVALAVGIIPDWLDRRARSGRVFQAAALGALVAFGIVQVNAAHMWLSQRTVAVSDGADRFLVHTRDRGFADVLTRLQALRAPGESLVVVPEGVMFNYLLRAENPTGVVNFLPPEMIMFGESRILAACRARPPVWVVLMNRGVGEYGYRFFGDDYGRDVYSWIEAGYEVVDRVFQVDLSGQAQPVAALLHRRADRLGALRPGRDEAAEPRGGGPR